MSRYAAERYGSVARVPRVPFRERFPTGRLIKWRANGRTTMIYYTR